MVWIPAGEKAGTTGIERMKNTFEDINEEMCSVRRMKQEEEKKEDHLQANLWTTPPPPSAADYKERTCHATTWRIMRAPAFLLNHFLPPSLHTAPPVISSFFH
jgi:hypothetical protein